MPAKLSTTIRKITAIPNATNSALVTKFYEYMKANGASERHQNNSLKMVIAFANFLGPDIMFYDITKKEQITAFLDTKIKSLEEDPDRKWITTWNYYLIHIKLFFRWLHNHNGKVEDEILSQSEWITPSFVKIKGKNTKRLSPYTDSEIWDQEELLTIVKYEPFIRNKAVLTLFWDLDARNHEITMLKIKNIRLKEKYGEGDIPYQAKTGSGQIMLTSSFPYVRDWINKHPFKNEPEARLICNLHNGSPVKPDAMWTMMKQLRKRIIRMLKDGSITNDKERQKLEYLLKTKKWNPYCIRHSAITSDSDYLPDYALKKKVRWSMNSKQSARYIKRRMGNDLKQKILVQNGIISEQQIERKPAILNCPRCSLVNAIENKYCSKCSYPLVPSAFDEIKEAENRKIQQIQDKYEQDMKAMREEMENKFQQILAKVDITTLK
jgi:hypothetical protein